MRVVCDLEANGLSPTKIWCIVCKDIDTGKVYAFDGRSQDTLISFRDFSLQVTDWVGHHFLSYDLGVLNRLVPGCSILWNSVTDTLVLSRLIDATRKGHSLEDWGLEFGVKKQHTDIQDWAVYDQTFLERCRSDVEINYLLFKKFEKYLNSDRWRSAIETEHYIAHLCNTLTKNGFAFNLPEALKLKAEIEAEVQAIDKELKNAFPPKVVFVREVTPRITKHGTLARNSIPKALGSDLTPYTADASFSLLRYQEFNPGSPKQIVERMNEAGWQPTEKTGGHKDAEKALRALKWHKGYKGSRKAEITALEARLEEYRVSGWAVSEENLATLPDTAPQAAKTLARRLMLANRVSTLNQWIEAYDETDGRIHGHFNHILPWTHRMSHDNPNMGNIPKYDGKQPHKTPYSDSMRALWGVGKDRYLVGVDAESIQLRIFGHYIGDEKFIQALISGRKEDGTDPHSLNQKALGNVCKSRDDAKTFIYAWLLGAGIAKIAQILGCSLEEARRANDNFLDFYPGLKLLREKIIPSDAARGYFEGFDGRYVRIRGDDVDSRRHFTLGGYLQNGEVIIMKRAVQIWYPRLEREKVPFWWVNFVHDEWQTETVRDLETAKYIAEVQADAIRRVGLDLGLRCPMAGSILNAHGKLAIGDNWMETH